MSTTRNFPFTIDLASGTQTVGNPSAAAHVNMKAGLTITGLNASAIGTTIRLRTGETKEGLAAKSFESTFVIVSTADADNKGVFLRSLNKGFNFFEIEVTPPASSAGTLEIKSTLYFDELGAPDRHPFSVDNDVTDIAVDTTEVPVLSFRIKSTSLAAKVLPSYVNILMVSNRDAIWRFYHTEAGEPDPLEGGASYNDSDSDNVEFDVAATAWDGSNSVKMYSGYISSLLEIAARDLTVTLGFECGGAPGDIYTMTGQKASSGGSTTMKAALGFDEIE